MISFKVINKLIEMSKKEYYDLDILLKMSLEEVYLRLVGNFMLFSSYIFKIYNVIKDRYGILVEGRRYNIKTSGIINEKIYYRLRLSNNQVICVINEDFIFTNLEYIVLNSKKCCAEAYMSLYPILKKISDSNREFNGIMKYVPTYRLKKYDIIYCGDIINRIEEINPYYIGVITDIQPFYHEINDCFYGDNEFIYLNKKKAIYKESIFSFKEKNILNKRMFISYIKMLYYKRMYYYSNIGKLSKANFIDLIFS